MKNIKELTPYNINVADAYNACMVCDNELNNMLDSIKNARSRVLSSLESALQSQDGAVHIAAKYDIDENVYRPIVLVPMANGYGYTQVDGIKVSVELGKVKTIEVETQRGQFTLDTFDHVDQVEILVSCVKYLAEGNCESEFNH